METRWLYTTSENLPYLRETAKDTCLIPMGGIQTHQSGMPVGMSVLQAKELAWNVSQEETVCVFPEFALGDVPSGHEDGKEGSIVLPVETEMLLLEQLCHQIARNGFKKIVILNCHSDNHHWLSAFLKKIENHPHKFVVMFISVKEEEQADAVEKVAKAIKFIKEDNELIDWHNRLWSLTNDDNLL